MNGDGDYYSSAYVVEVQYGINRIPCWSIHNFDEIKSDEGGDVIISLDVGDLEFESDEPACLQD